MWDGAISYVARLRSIPIAPLPPPQFNAALIFVPVPIIKSNTASPVSENVNLEILAVSIIVIVLIVFC